VPIKEIVLNPTYLVRSLDDRHLVNLQDQIKEEGLIEPITVNKESNGDLTLIAGQHRLMACINLDFDTIDAKIYWELEETVKIVLGYMSNEVRKRPAAGERFKSLADLYTHIEKELIGEGKMPTEENVINATYFSGSKMRVNEIIKGKIVDRLRNDPEFIGCKLKIIQNSQVPKKKIILSIENAEYPLLTAQNVFVVLTHLCRAKPISTKEEEDGKNFREDEYKNVLDFMNRVITEFIEPWIAVKDIDSAMSFCKRHPFEAFVKLVADKLIAEGHPGVSSKAAPLYHDETINWDNVFAVFKPLKSKDVWTYGPITNVRNVNDIQNELRCYMSNGHFP